LLGTAAPSRRPQFSRVYGVIVFSRPDSARIALDGASTDGRRIFGVPGQRGCMGYGEPHVSRVTVWEDDSGGGMALVEPLRGSASTDEALTSLIVFPRGRKAKDALPGFRTTGRQASWPGRTR
jgi:hypothetical protein